MDSVLFAVGTTLHSEGSYEDALGLMTDGLSWALPDAVAVEVGDLPGT